MPSQDALLVGVIPPVPLAPSAQSGDRRYLWLRLILTTLDPKHSPSVTQARAATPSENYLDYVPLTYSLNDLPSNGAGGMENTEGFLSRLLKLMRSEWSGVEEAIDDMARVCDSQFVEASDLPWLAQWLALELPQIANDEERRDLIAHAVGLFARRGTPGSIAEFVALHTGIRPTIIESFEDRHIWMLGYNSRLDFDTQLPPLDPQGLVVPDLDATGMCCSDGLVGGTIVTHSACDAGVDAMYIGNLVPGPIGQATVGESGPLEVFQFGLPVFSEEAYRFCVFVDAYRVRDDATLQEIRRILDREKPAHTDYRIELIEPNLRVGLQSRVGIDAIVGGDPPPWRFAATLDLNTRLNPADSAARVGDVKLGETMTLT
jgi:phage tail-like protein